MRKLDDIIPPSRRREAEPLTKSSARQEQPRTNRLHTSSQTTIFAVVAVIIASVGALYYFSTAKVEITPNTVGTAVQNSFSATKGDDSTLSYEIITVQKSKTQSVKSSGTKETTSYASGSVTVYNTQSKPQKLINNTRFATTAGLIFRIHAPITIPAGSASKPGSVTAKLYADKPGDSYNVDPTSFTVPGLAGTPQSSQVYARSSSAMTGGTSGTIPVVDAAIEAEARTALREALAAELAESIQSQIPSGYVLLSGAATTTYTSLAPVASSADSLADISENATITAVVFPDIPLAKAVAASAAGLGYQDESVSFVSTDKLNIVMTGLPSQEDTSLTFTLAGTTSLVYLVDPTRIAAAIAGKTRQGAQVALANYPEVKRAVIVLRPFWRQTFPQDPSSISILVNNP